MYNINLFRCGKNHISSIFCPFLGSRIEDKLNNMDTELLLQDKQHHMNNTFLNNVDQNQASIMLAVKNLLARLTTNLTIDRCCCL